MTDNISIGKRLREWANSKYNNNMADFARALKVKPQQVYDYFSGKSKPGNKLQAKLQALGCDLHWLMYGETSENINDQFKASVERKYEQLFPNESRLLNALKSLGITTEKQLMELFNPDTIGANVATMLREKVTGYKRAGNVNTPSAPSHQPEADLRDGNTKK